MFDRFSIGTQRPHRLRRSGQLSNDAKQPLAFATGSFGMPDKSIDAWRNRQFHTGDGACCDEDGFFTFIDRLEDAIRRRWENISSYETEQVPLSHPAVAVVQPSRRKARWPKTRSWPRSWRAKALRSIRWNWCACEPRTAYFAVSCYVDFMRRCRPPRTTRCRSSSCAIAASLRRAGTAKRPASSWR